MSRKLVLKALSVAVPVALLVGVGWEAVSSGSVRPSVPPVTFTGAVSCNLQGTLSISPPAFGGTGGTYTLTFRLKNNKCVGLPYQTPASGAWNPTSLTQGGETLKGSKERFTVTVLNSSLCNALEYGGALAQSAFSYLIDWVGTSPINSTTGGFPNGSMSVPVPGVITLTNGTATDSFAGTIDISLGYNVASVFTACGTTVQTKGLSSLTVNHLGGDNLLVGPGF